jgi:sugar O-acyltransferase (sialic acid O-acetyltransferase NeuD family)
LKVIRFAFARRGSSLEPRESVENRLIIIGAGGAGLEALFVALRMNSAPEVQWVFLGWADDARELRGTTVGGFPVLGTPAEIAKSGVHFDTAFFCAIGCNRTRQRIAELFASNGYLPATLIDPTAIIAHSAKIGGGCYIGPQAFVGPGAVLGRHVLVNVGASLGHHCIAGDFVQVCPGGRISGCARLADGAFVGSNGVVAPGVSIAEWATVGAGSLAARDVPAHATALGVPAKILAVPHSG